MQDSWKEDIEHGKSLLSLGQRKTLSFSGDGGGQVAWKGCVSLTEPSGSSSSAVVSPSNGAAEEKASSENSGQSGSVLKEHDYIGLAEVSSASSLKTQPNADSPQELNLEETDLRLGLGLGLGPLKKTEPAEDAEKTLGFTLAQQDGVPKTVVDATAATTTRYAFLEGAQDQKSLQSPWPNAPMRPITADNPNPTRAPSGREFQAPQICLPVQDYGVGAPRVVNAFPGARVGGHSPASKNGVKRGYTEAMTDAARFNMATETRAAAAMVVKNGDSDVRVLPNKHQQNAFLPNWAPSKPTVPTPWHVGLEQSAGHSFVASKSAPVMTVPRVEKPAADCAAAAYKTHDPSETAQESATNEPPPPKGQVVGWPPIRSYRKNTLAKPTEMFVKVNMDGVTVGRKVDLNAHSSYEGLLLALEEMFQPSNNAQGNSQPAAGRDSDVKHFRLMNGSDFALTYEDKDGDWMLVGDVPWSMFVNTVRRLRITRGPEATGLAPRGSEKIK